MERFVEVAILVIFVVGSVGYVGNGNYESRHGFSHPVLRLMRNLGIALIWPLLVLRAVL